LLDVGGIAPEFSLWSVDGEIHSLSDALRQGRTLLVFFKIACPTCQLTLPFLDRLLGNVQVIGVSQDDTASTKDFLDYFKISFPVLIDPSSNRYATSSAYRLTNVPSIFLVEPDRKISWALNGFHRAELEDLASRLGTAIFRQTDRVPAMKPG
jgi:peroxiredoxin